MIADTDISRTAIFFAIIGYVIVNSSGCARLAHISSRIPLGLTWITVYFNALIQLVAERILLRAIFVFLYAFFVLSVPLFIN